MAAKIIKLNSDYNKWYHYLIATTAMEREAVTIRFPADLLAKARKLKQGSESLNDLVIEALKREVRRRRGWAVHQRIIARSETVKAKTGIQPASTDLIRSLREGEGRRD
ncbi:MAG: YlcI/YnfO family protein [Heteroscytonema crispum UTEX LB 1556]